VSTGRDGRRPQTGKRPHAEQGQPCGTDEQPLISRRDYEMELRATAENATVLRRDFASWLAVDVRGELGDALVLAVYEAVANAVEHAYAGDPPDGVGVVRVHAHRDEDGVVVTVADEGRWRGPTGVPHRGHGLPLIHSICRDVRIVRSDAGTVVHLHVEVPPPLRP
jgi:serine/threonine-protein kinase RsbW